MGKYLILSIILLFNFSKLSAQLELCSGDKGAPIFVETFGVGNKGVNKAAIGITNYKFVRKKVPKDGEYTISNKFDWYPSWYKTKDHTKFEKNGNALIVNVHKENIEYFFTRKISNLCPDVSYEFSAWILNLSKKLNSPCTKQTAALGGLPINVRFEIWDETNTEILRFASTGQIFSKSSPKWVKYGTVFTTAPGQDSVILKISNYSRGGCGNDVAIDDIQFASCGDHAVISSNRNTTNELKVCQYNSNEVELNITSSNTHYFKKHFFQWQKSLDSIHFKDISTATSSSLKITDTLSAGEHYYRVKVAGSKGSLVNSNCYSISEQFKLNIVAPSALPTLEDNKDFCFGEEVILRVKRPNKNVVLRWYDSKEGGNMLKKASSYYNAGKLPSGRYTFYVESEGVDYECTNKERLPVNVLVHEKLPELKDDRIVEKCSFDEVMLDSEVDDVEYLWNTGETTKSITVSNEGKYYVSINAKNNDYCKMRRNFDVINFKGPEVTKILQEGSNLTVQINQTSGVYEYSINGGETYKDSPTFEDIKNGHYKFYVKRIDTCEVRGPGYYYTKLND